MQSELFLSCVDGQRWAVLREDGATVEVQVEDPLEPKLLGSVIKARVNNVLPGIQSAFLDAGLDRGAFLHAAELLPDASRSRVAPDAGTVPANDEGSEGTVRRRRSATAEPPIQDRLRAGTELIVQVTRSEIRSKGARVTCHVTLPGRYMVFAPHMNKRGVSRRIDDPEERERLRRVLGEFPADAGGFIVRTAGRGAAPDALRADAEFLMRLWRGILARAESATAPAVLHEELDLPLRLLRDAPRRGVSRVLTDDPREFERMRSYIGPLDPELASKVGLHTGDTPLLESYGLDRDVERGLRPHVWLRSGGHLVIEETEALVSIDVNTGKYVGRRDLDETVLRTNLEAAEEIARQLRLRDLGGIIVVDFIDMARAEDRTKVIESLQAVLRRDRARTKVVGLGELGLLQLTRKRTRPGLGAQLTHICPTCGGRGRVKSPAMVAAEAMTEVQRLRDALADQSITVRAHPEVARALNAVLRDEPAAERSSELAIEEDATLRPDRFDVIAW